MAKLPESFEEKSLICNMEIGDSGFITPWGMWMDNEGKCFLNEKYNLHPVEFGTANLKITRVIDGYLAHIHEMKDDYKWEKQSNPVFMTDAEFCYGPVVGFDKPSKKKIQTFPVRELPKSKVQSISLLGKLKSLFSSN